MLHEEFAFLCHGASSHSLSPRLESLELLEVPINLVYPSLSSGSNFCRGLSASCEQNGSALFNHKAESASCLCKWLEV